MDDSQIKTLRMGFDSDVKEGEEEIGESKGL